MGLPSASTAVTFSAKVGANVGAKVGTKVVLNLALPGAGSAVDFGEAIYDCAQGNYPSAAINVASGVFDIVTLGLWGAAKEAAQGTAKAAATGVVKKTAKEATKKVGQEAGKSIAKGASKEATVAAAKAASKEATKKVGSQFAKELSMGMLENAVELGAYKATKKAVPDLLAAAARGSLQSGLVSGSEIAKGVYGEVLHDSFAEMLKQVPKQTFKSGTAYAAQNAAFDFLKEEAKRATKRELAKATAQGCARWAQGN